MEQIELKVAGMTCGSCVSRVSRTLLGVPGVRDAEVDLARGQARVTADDARAAQPALLQALADAGYPAQLAAAAGEPARAAAGTGCGGGGKRAGGGCCCGH